jgi:hypothetical protein
MIVPFNKCLVGNEPIPRKVHTFISLCKERNIIKINFNLRTRKAVAILRRSSSSSSSMSDKTGSGNSQQRSRPQPITAKFSADSLQARPIIVMLKDYNNIDSNHKPFQVISWFSSYLKAI